MTRRSLWWSIGASVAALFVLGSQYWRIPYSSADLPDSLLGYGLIGVAVCALVAQAFGRGRLLPTIAIVGASVPAVIMLRVAVEVALDPTSHNLWPFEVLIGAFVGLGAASAGAVVGSVGQLKSSGGSDKHAGR